MTRREVAHVQHGRAERRDLSRLTLGEEAISDPTLIHHLDRARVETSGPRADEDVIETPLDDRDVDLRQRQLSREHHPHRTASGDNYRMVGHRRGPLGYAEKNTRTSLLHLVGSGLRTVIMRHDPGLVSSPPIGYKLAVERKT